MAKFGWCTKICRLDEIHPQARQAAEAARCAGDQGKFWEYHDKLYEHSPKASADDLKAYAKEIGLNMDSFRELFREWQVQSCGAKGFDRGGAVLASPARRHFLSMAVSWSERSRLKRSRRLSTKS